MKKIVNTMLAAAFLACSTLGAVALPTMVSAASPVQQAQEGANASGAEDGPEFTGVVQIVANLLIFLIGIAAVIMIIIGAIRYTTANGDQTQLTAAKNTILYSIVGLILAIAAGGIVNFILNQFAFIV